MIVKQDLSHFGQRRAHHLLVNGWRRKKLKSKWFMKLQKHVQTHFLRSKGGVFYGFSSPLTDVRL